MSNYLNRATSPPSLVGATQAAPASSPARTNGTTHQGGSGSGRHSNWDTRPDRPGSSSSTPPPHTSGCGPWRRRNRNCIVLIGTSTRILARD